MTNNRHRLAAILGNFKELKEVLNKTSDANLVTAIFNSLPSDPFYADASSTSVAHLYVEIIRNPRTTKDVLLQIIRNVQLCEKDEFWDLVNSVLELRPQFTEEEQSELASILDEKHLINFIPILTNEQVIADICKIISNREIYDIAIWSQMVAFIKDKNWLLQEFQFSERFLKNNNQRQLSGHDLLEPFLKNKLTPSSIITVCLNFELSQEFAYIHNLTKIVKHPNLLPEDRERINKHFSKDVSELEFLIDLVDPED